MARLRDIVDTCMSNAALTFIYVKLLVPPHANLSHWLNANGFDKTRQVHILLCEVSIVFEPSRGSQKRSGVQKHSVFFFRFSYSADSTSFASQNSAWLA